MKIFKQKEKNFINDIKYFLESRVEENVESINQSVKEIINDVRLNGDSALIKYTKMFDNFDLIKSEILMPKNIRDHNQVNIDNEIMNSFELAIKNITKFHQKQIPENHELEENKLRTGSFWRAIDSVGLYVPGGKAAYPSSLLMNAIPAKVAGVKRIVVTTPCVKGIINPYVVGLLDILEIEEVYQVGGAQAIAALAYGTKTIKPVNKIFGPGNAYIASAKRQVFGKVGIDLIAGPSEIVIVADKDNNPDWVASDLIAQAEHDEKAQSILITDNEEFSAKVITRIKIFVNQLPKRNIIQKSISNFGATLILDNLDNAAEIINLIAPEHVHLQNQGADEMLKKINNAGSIFISPYSSEAFGDYIVGTNHILPTFGSAKFSSGLGVLDFMKRTSYVSMNENNYLQLSKHVAGMAAIEKLEGHKLSVTIRQKDKK